MGSAVGHSLRDHRGDIMIDHVRANNKACIVKRKGGGLPDREFDSVRDAADWCRETGRSRARPKLVIASIATRVFCGFIWTAEHVSSDDSVDRALISGNDAALPSLERADSVSASHDKTLTVCDIIDRTSEEVEKEKRDIADLQRKLEERQWFLQQLEDYTSPHEYD